MAAETTPGPDHLGLGYIVAGVVLACATAAAPLGAAELTLATWNIEHLAARDGAGCRPRDEVDYRRLRDVAERMDADIIAVQEVQNADALARVFDRDRYDLVVSPRRETGRDTCRGMGNQRRTAQRTGFAIRRDALRAQGLDYRVLPGFRALGVDARRWGTRILLESASDAEQRLELMSVHLKSGCAYNRLDGRVERNACRTLIRQRGVLEEWIDARAADDQPFVILGDFNRQLDQRNDHFWVEIDDASVCDWRDDRTLGRRCEPATERDDPDADLRLAGAGEPFPFAYNPKYPYAIDHIVLGGEASDWLVRNSYSPLDYRRSERAGSEKPSDHHPITVRLRLPW
jgi:endonuclease/exonuclease/phosphatase family metal-dependent hydrolase